MADRGSSMVFADDVVEKVGRLVGVLESIGEHPRLRGNLALHGGYPDIAERASRNPATLHKLEGIRTAIERGIIGV